MEQSKRCAKCRETKPVSDFGPGKKWRDGLFPYCRPCARSANKATHEKHKARYAAQQRDLYQRQRDDRIAKVAARDRANPVAANARKVAWAKANVEKTRAARKRWQQANMATFVRSSNARRRALKANAPTLPFDPEQIFQRVAYYGGRCWVCRVAEFTALDHVKPLARGGWHCLANLRPICTACNTRKRDRWPYAPPAAA